MDETPIVNVVRTDPGLWIERLVIFGDIREQSVIRDIRFTRGLNIVYGVSEIEDDEDAASDNCLSGHSVGKTTLCRLIRFGLGEETFSQGEATKLITHYFGPGGIGLTVHLNGTRWSVIRDFRGVERESKAAPECEIEDLVTKKASKDLEFGVFQQSVKKLLLDGIPGFDDRTGYKWRHLLSWLMRDQEARYESFYKWRDARSNSQIAQLTKQPALLLAASVMGLCSVELTRHLEQRSKLETERTVLVEAVELHDRRRTADVASYDTDIARILKKYGYPVEAHAGLFSFDTLVNDCLSAVREMTDTHVAKRKAVETERRSYDDDQSQITLRLRKIGRYLQVSKGLIEPEEGGRLLDQLEMVQGDACLYGKIPYSECSYFMRHLESLRDPLQNFMRTLEDDAAADNSDVRRQQIMNWLAEQLDYKSRLDAAIDAVGRLDAEIHASDDRVNVLMSDFQQLGRLYELRQLANRDSPYESNVLHLQEEIAATAESIAAEREKTTVAGNELKELFNRVVQFVLSQDFKGRVQFRTDEPVIFSIDGWGGEAVQTFTTVLADLVAMLLSVEGYGYHPRFVVHDSPREADLSGAAYARFLRRMHSLSEGLGGNLAPFQYIVTTTTKPPSVLDDTVRLRLRASPEEDLLFRKSMITRGTIAMDL